MTSNGVRQLSPKELALVCGGTNANTVTVYGPEPDHWAEPPQDPWNDPFYYGGGGGGGDSSSSLDEYQTTGLGDQVDAILNKSPTLESMLNAAKDWGVQILPTTGNSEFRSNENTVYININGTPEQIITSLTHELGHAIAYATRDDSISYSSSKEDFIDYHTDTEAEATMFNIAVDRELAAQGIDILIAGNGANFDAYNSAYDQYMAGGSWTQAVDTISDIFKTNEKVGGVTYEEYYGDWWERNQP